MNVTNVVRNGFTMIEMLISLVLGLVLLAGIIELFLNARITYEMNEGVNQLQDNGRFISSFLPQMIRQAGFRSLPQSTLYPNFNTAFSAANPFLSATDNTGVNNSDTLTIRFQGSGDGLGHPDGKLKDCLSLPVDSNEIVTNIFALNANSELQCRTLHPNSIIPVDRTESLVEGVENFQILFGEDLNNDLTPDRYVPANFPGLDMNNVTSIRISLLLKTTNEVSQIVDTHTYNLLNSAYTPLQDKRVRRNYTSTVYLRNRASTSAL